MAADFHDSYIFNMWLFITWTFFVVLLTHAVNTTRSRLPSSENKNLSNYFDGEKLIIVLNPKLNDGTSDTRDFRRKLHSNKVVVFGKPSSHTLNDEEKLKAALVHRQHARKVRELNEFMDKKYLSTNYFYDEMRRIKDQREVKDELRQMIDYLEKYSHLKAEVLKCYKLARAKNLYGQAIWQHKTNNLVINAIKKPETDGVV